MAHGDDVRRGARRYRQSLARARGSDPSVARGSHADRGAWAWHTAQGVGTAPAGERE
jgi:hypothetical protein